MYFWKSLCLLALIIASVQSTQVKKCPKSSARLLEPTEVTISNCPKNKCILKRNTKVDIEMKVVPTRDFNELNNDISGILQNVPLPFPGIYGTSACPNIYDAEGKKAVGCPLKAGETYTYKNSFDILPIYPTVTLEIHCGLGDTKGDAACFQIPARIK
ncbi:ecdysteroid-regulated 16 kDa protein [Eupeodes corollae]|uniref:ecdysteroid-regulated 16 kDa protein n=1 Tax=Eupeodes corollae TaxID=290404 RepID=UPI0024924231|nr:ecdysteroid-regulated 16 kDa protein [Eupeodes corollae]